MYRCMDCGNEDKFYGMVKEQGDALIFQNTGSAVEPLLPGQPVPAPGEGRSSLLTDNTVKDKLWAIQNNGNDDGFTWAYLASKGSWKGFHEIRSCAVCHSTNISLI